jgi:hypothetical protein
MKTLGKSEFYLKPPPPHIYACVQAQTLIYFISSAKWIRNKTIQVARYEYASDSSSDSVKEL